MSDSSRTIELTGLDGSNPLAFLATLGALRCLEYQNPDARPRLAWTAAFRPVIDSGASITRADLIEILSQGVAAIAALTESLGPIIGVPVETYRRFSDPFPKDDAGRTDNARLTFAAGFASDAVVDEKKGTVIPSALSFSNGQGGKLLLKDFRTLASRMTAERLSAALFAPWQYDDCNEPTFRWDPLDMRTGAHMATDPGSTETRSVMAANALAVVGLSFFPVVPADETLRTTAVRRIENQSYLAWPLWTGFIDSQVVASLMQRTEWLDDTGVFAQFAARRFKPNGQNNLYLTASFAI